VSAGLALSRFCYRCLVSEGQVSAAGLVGRGRVRQGTVWLTKGGALARGVVGNIQESMISVWLQQQSATVLLGQAVGDRLGGTGSVEQVGRNRLC
jgi:hypothetical protein